MAEQQGPGHRPVDLARAAGVSTQQIRNYADAGILPPAPRTAAGYRRFDDSHLDALLAYRALARGCGPQQAQAVLRAVHAGDRSGALALLDGAHAALHRERQALDATGKALAALADRPRQPRRSQRPSAGLRIGEVAALVGVRTSAVRTWEAAGLLVPGREHGTGYRSFGAADVRDAQVTAMLRRAHYRLPQIGAVLDDLRRTGSTDALRAVVADRRAALDGQAAALLEAAVHLSRCLGAR
ncbi:MerR family transcriptional regulator [Kitasatospora sp. DSM 101779]|uniref:MerR family transcriptional regulator n=1 Tax=Kitasatospora sp. DSM 101779 TaxID=2853165 RepID=UPI0021DA4A0E|nr:MerR family transcriptional regulator [Kitasatospora sp. DSM 101779]MCU7826634.1 MerR family transcriptional regulator [Kitasatospora sp. DSM 101779]